MPPISRIGMNTAISEMLIDSTVKPTSCAPSSAACSGGMPASTWRVMFSSTTMASSTTKPVAMVSAISDRLSRLKPSRYITPNVPSSETGTATAGIRVARAVAQEDEHHQDHQQRSAISSVRSTSCSEARMVVVRSIATSRSIVGGIERLQLRQQRLDAVDGRR